MRMMIVAVLALAVAGAVFYGWKSQHLAPNAAPLPPAAHEELWTPERIAAHPQDYLVWSDGQVQQQIQRHEARLNTLNQQRAEVERRRQQMEGDLADVKNIHDRMQRAYRQADDEDRWPLHMAGKEFSRSAADAIIAKTQKYLDDRASLAHSYDDSVERIDQLVAAVHKDIADLNALREKLALDLEKGKLQQGMAELDNSRAANAQIQVMMQTLSQIDQQTSLALPPANDAKDRADVEQMLK